MTSLQSGRCVFLAKKSNFLHNGKYVKFRNFKKYGLYVFDINALKICEKLEINRFNSP